MLSRDAQVKIQILKTQLAEGIEEQLIASDSTGALYSADSQNKKENVSVVNTSEVYRCVNAYPHIFSRELRDHCESWRKDTLLPQAKKYAAKLTKSISPIDEESSAYRLAQIARATDLTSGCLSSLNSWQEKYLKRWLLGDRSYFPSMLIIYLVENSKGNAESRNPLSARFAEFVILQNCSEHNAHGSYSMDLVDLSLGVLLLNRVDILSTLQAQALKILNEISAKQRIWSNRNSISGFGRSHVAGASSIYACLFLMKAGPAIASSLGKSIEGHVDWLLNQAPQVNGLLLSDLDTRIRSPEPWFNALCIEFLSEAEKWSNAHAQAGILNKYNGQVPPSTIEWKNLALSSAVRNSIETHILSEAQRSGGCRMETCSAILFGPPGTAKTTIAESVASYLNRPFVEIGVSDFLEQGLERIFAKSNEIFSDLYDLDEAVILFDEVEGVFADRSADGRALLQKFLTSALLPPLKRLRARGTNVIFIATNYIREFDKAAKRPGRIDLILPVGPPEGSSRIALLQEMVGLSPKDAAAIDANMDKRVTLAEIFALKRFVAEDLSVSEVFGQWEASVGHALEITSDEYKQFESDVSTYSRYTP